MNSEINDDNNNNNITINKKNNIDIEIDKINKTEILQEKVNLNEEKNKIKNEFDKENNLNKYYSKENECDYFKTLNILDNISYENKDIQFISNKKIKNEIKEEEIKSEYKNNNINKKKERNKLLLKLLVNKELSRISFISKELINKNNNNINNEIEENIENKNFLNIKENNIDGNENKKENIDVNNFENNSNKNEALKIIELLKLKNNKKNNKDIQEKYEEKNKSFNYNENTNLNLISKKEIKKDEIKNEEMNSNENSKKNTIISKGNILHRFINKNLKKSESFNNNKNNKNIINNKNNSRFKNINKDKIIYEKHKCDKKTNLQKINLNNNNNNNKNIINYNLNDIMRRKKLENDLAIEISKIEISGEWYKDNKNIYKKNDNDDNNIKIKEIIFKENKNNENYNKNYFDKNETIQISLFDPKNNDNNNKVYSKKNLLNNKEIKYKTNINFYNKNKEKKINNIYPKKIIEKNIKSNKNNNNNNIIIYNKNIIDKNKSFGYNNNKNINIIYNNNNDNNILKNIYQNKSFEINNNNKKILENKIIKYKIKNNSSFNDEININSKNKIYIKKNSINNSQSHNYRNKSVKYINKYQNDYFGNKPSIKNNINKIYIVKTNNENNIENNNNNNNNYYINNNSFSPSLINNNNNINRINNKIFNQNIIIFIIEEVLVLEDKLSEIIISLNTEKSIANYCFEFWNYFYNSTLYYKFEIIFKNYNEINIIKLNFNLILFTIMICYDFSFESNKLINIYLFLSEILELNHKNLILILEYITNKINFNNNKENNWIIRAYNIINNFNLTEDNEYYYNNMSYIEIIITKIKLNINSLMQKINYILLTNKTNFNECLISLFNKIKNESFNYIDEFFKEYLLRENFIECSVIAKTYLKEKSIFEPENAPYIKNINNKKFSLVLDLDETLINFKLNKDHNDEGVLKLRPNLYKFLDGVMNYYELILFTEASQTYIDLLINALEENKKYFEHKLYRQHTVIIGNDFIKDLTRIGRPLNSIIIIDNMPQNFRLQKGNGINIKSFWGEDDDEDNTLLELMTILINIAKEEDDVRKGIIKYHEEIITKISSNIYKHNKY